MRDTYGSRRAMVLYGLRGIGEPQLTIVYAMQHKGNRSVVFWLNIEDGDSLKQGLIRAVEQILCQPAKHRGYFNVVIT